MSLKPDSDEVKTTVPVSRLVQLQALQRGHALGLRTWQDVALHAIHRFLEDAPKTNAPSGMRAILVPATLPDEDAALLEMAGSELARLAERERKDFADQAEHQRGRVKAIEPVEMQLKRRKAR